MFSEELFSLPFFRRFVRTLVGMAALAAGLSTHDHPTSIWPTLCTVYTTSRSNKNAQCVYPFSASLRPGNLLWAVQESDVGDRGIDMRGRRVVQMYGEGDRTIVLG